MNFGRFQQYLVAVVRNLLINQPRLVRGISGTSAHAHRASLVRADRLTLLRAVWIFLNFNPDEIWCLQTLCLFFSFWVTIGYNYTHQDQNTTGQAPYYPPPAQAYPLQMSVSNPASAPPTCPPVGYPQAALQPQAQPQTIIYNQALSGPPQQQQQDEVVAVGCLEGW